MNHSYENEGNDSLCDHYLQCAKDERTSAFFDRLGSRICMASMIVTSSIVYQAECRPIGIGMMIASAAGFVSFGKEAIDSHLEAIDYEHRAFMAQQQHRNPE